MQRRRHSCIAHTTAALAAATLSCAAIADSQNAIAPAPPQTSVLIEGEATSGAVLFYKDHEVGDDVFDDALSGLGISPTFTSDPASFAQLIGSQSWDCIIAAQQNWSDTSMFASQLSSYVEGGGHAILTDWTLDAGLASSFGASYTGGSNETLIATDGHPVWAGLPADVSLSNPGWGIFSMGLSATTGIPTGSFPFIGNAVVEGNDGRTLINGFLSDTFANHSEGVRVATNEIEFCLDGAAPTDDPVPDIKANGSDGPIVVTRGTPVRLRLWLDPGQYTGIRGDWFVYCDTPRRTISYIIPRKRWRLGMHVSLQRRLLPRQGLRVRPRPLPLGETTCYFGVDTNPNGSIGDPSFFDSVDIRVVDELAQCDAPPYEPWVWNDGGSVQQNNNCYNYANDKITYTFAQPGRYCGDYPNPMSCDAVYPAAQCDGLLPSTKTGSCPDGMHKVYLVVWPDRDYHWYRLDEGAGGKWSHKPGSTAVNDTDSSGSTIYDPGTADISPYSERCGYMCACGGDSATIQRAD